jgi:hypothetical protein
MEFEAITTLRSLKTQYAIAPNNHRRCEVRDSAGRLTMVQEYKGIHAARRRVQTTYNYDNMGRATSTTRTIDGTAYHLGFSYLNGRLDSITYPDNETIAYTYDAGSLKGVTGYISYSNFDAIGRPLM